MNGHKRRLWAAGYRLRCIDLLLRAWEQNAPDDLISRIESLIIGIEKYSDDQPRDDHGRWTSGGSGGYNSGAISGALKHEYMELRLMEKGFTQDEAHIRTSKRYNFAKYCE